MLYCYSFVIYNHKPNPLIEFEVYEENGNMDSKHFVIKVSDDWHWPSLSVDILDCDCQDL
jgi:hypothetical protein